MASFDHVMQSDLEVLAANLRTRRRELRLTAAELSKVAGLDRSYVSSIENATRGSYPKLTTVEKLARALRVTPDQLMGRAAFNVPSTPYDTNPEYRALIAALESLSPVDRSKFLTFADWFMGIAKRGDSDTSAARKETFSETPRTDEELGIGRPGEPR